MNNQPDFNQTIDVVESIRGGNNKLWMQILRIAMRSEPDLTRAIIAEIGTNDKEITKWLGKL